jgi:hypothetical protein
MGDLLAVEPDRVLAEPVLVIASSLMLAKLSFAEEKRCDVSGFRREHQIGAKYRPGTLCGIIECSTTYSHRSH